MQRKKISATTERQITTAAIVSDSFLLKYAKKHDPEIIQAEFIRIVLDWCVSYFNKYQKAPKEHIQDLYEERESNLDPDTADLIADFLESISEEHERAETINAEYIYDEAIEYLNERKLRNLRQDINVHLQNGDITEARNAVSSFLSVEKDTDSAVDPFDDKEAIKEAFQAREKPLLKLPQALSMYNTAFTRDALIGIQAPEKRGKCITGDSLIHLSDGSLMRMEEVVRKKIKNVLAYDEISQKFLPTEISHHYDNGEKDCVEVVSRSGRRVKTTLNHPFLTPTGWKNVENLKEGDFVAVPKRLNFFGNGKARLSFVKMLAYMIAEGGMTKRDSPTFTSSFKDIKKDFEECVNDLGSSVTWHKHNPITCTIANAKCNKGKHNQNVVKNLLENHGLMEVHSRDKKIPSIIFKQNKKNVAAFIRTLFTCDGSVFEEGVEYSSASRDLIYQLQMLLTRFGIVAGIKYKKAKCNGKIFDHWSLCIRDFENIKLFVDEIGFDFEKKVKSEKVIKNKEGKKEKSFLDIYPSEIVKEIKKDVFNFSERIGQSPYSLLGKGLYEAIRNSIVNDKPLMRCTVKKIYEKVPTDYLKTVIDSDIFWDRIESIESVGKIHTYDLTVKKYHNFVADNCLVHNTWWLLLFAMLGHAQRLNVAFFSVGDMTQPQFIRRQHIYLAKRSDDERYCGELLVPILDCMNNQLDKCTKDCREGDEGIWDGEEKLTYDDIPDYIPCCVCKNKNNSDYIGAHWYEKRVSVNPLTWEEAYNIAQRRKKRLKSKQFKLSTHPSHTVSATDIDNLLTKWEREEDWIADLILIDYADILAPEPGSKEFRHQENAKWSKLRAISQKRRACVIVATQADVKAHESARQKITNFSEDKRKMAHVTAMFALNQTPEEKREKIMRFQSLLIREDENDIEQDVVVLQCLQQGRAHLASYVKKTGKQEAHHD